MRGNGIGSAALYKLMSRVFDEMEFKKMKTMVLDNNKIAIKLYKKMGFKKEGMLKQQLLINGRHIDAIPMRILQEEWINIKEKLRVMIEN